MIMIMIIIIIIIIMCGGEGGWVVFCSGGKMKYIKGLFRHKRYIT